MSAIEYNDLLYEISERLGELNVLDRLLFMCRGNLASGSEDRIQDVLSLFQELEQRKYLGTDHLEVVKDLLKRLKEWHILRKVQKFESKRKEYLGLLEQVIRVLDELNEMKRLMSICRRKLSEESVGNIHDVRSLFKVLENYNCLGVDSLSILKEILIELEKGGILKEVEEFEKRRCEDDEFESRKGN